ncbi:MAG: tRNA guanosine(34) transglycosylase Tgt [Candidatus Liptonbacteria bacterium]|nr:tRNA guanosine(34) transglycosylase Tgt [Candidatus Liptonbacteria bacterium]
MIQFSVLKKSNKSRARLGILKTSHGEIETPSLVPVATLASIKGLRSDEVLKTKTQILISNTYHLHLMPGEKVVQRAGGLNKFMNWPRPTMTDSGGFQVFSLGFGRDFGVGKVQKATPDTSFPGKLERAIEKGSQPKSLRITRDGVHFKSPLSGVELFLGPRESIAIQEKLGADIIFAFDECTPPHITHEYAKKSLELTNAWAKKCIDAKKSKQSLFGIVQGSQFKDLRVQSAKLINSLSGFDGFGIGGDLGESKTGSKQILDWVIPHLDEKKPRHLLGIGHIEDMEIIVKGGVDLFDCTVPTHYARRGIAFTNKGRVNFAKAALLKDKNPIDFSCECLVCAQYRRDYIAHLIRAKEITGGALLTFHNLFFFNTYVEKIREKIRRGII